MEYFKQITVWLASGTEAAAVIIALARVGGAVAAAQTAAKQPPITIEINSSPWYGGFEMFVDRDEKETGNKVTLDVTPYPGMLQSRAMRSAGARASTISSISTPRGRSSSTRAGFCARLPRSSRTSDCRPRLSPAVP